MLLYFLTACSAGTFSSSGECLKCPANTVTTGVAVDQCECESGYFRNNVTLDRTCSDLLQTPNEDATTNCTGNVTVLI